MLLDMCWLNENDTSKYACVAVNLHSKRNDAVHKEWRDNTEVACLFLSTSDFTLLHNQTHFMYNVSKVYSVIFIYNCTTVVAAKKM